MLTCLKCSSTFKTVAEREKHVRNYHEKPKQCTTCDKMFTLASELQKHRKACQPKRRIHVHMNRGDSYKEEANGRVEETQKKRKVCQLPNTCPQCQKELKKENLKEHIETVHSKTWRYWCRFCNKAGV